MIRFLDGLFSFVGIIVLLPVYLLTALLIKLGSKGPVFYKQWRVGKDGIPFKLFKFRTMRADADKKGLLTVGGRDERITAIGYHLRKYKLDELPQLLNVLAGEMSIVGPRPEVQKYVDLYSDSQREVLKIRPGITDLASISFRNENELLAGVEDAETYYINEVMPRKIELNFLYIKNQNLKQYFGIILKTIMVAMKGN